MEMAQGWVDEYYGDETGQCMSTLILIPGTSLLPKPFLAIVYFIFIAWLFMGIAIVAEIFMEAIEVITSKTVVVEVEDDDGKLYPIEVPVWNATIANLSLMALGSSAPEIFISVIDTVRTLGEPQGAIGPSTIVGSAAFNLLVISALCIVAVEDEEGKKIADLGVFTVTSVWSMIAYLWLFACLSLISPGEVDLVEAWLTFSFFIILMIMAYAVDRYNANNNSKVEEKENIEAEKRNGAKAALRSKARKLEKDNITGDNILIKIATGVKDKDTNTVNETEKQEIEELFRTALECKDLSKVDIKEMVAVFEQQSLFEKFAARKATGVVSDKEFLDIKGQKAQIENYRVTSVRHENPKIGFKCMHYAVAESAGHVTVTIVKKNLSMEE
jgi:Ca2+/Na+ antiporter